MWYDAVDEDDDPVDDAPAEYVPDPVTYDDASAQVLIDDVIVDDALS